MYSVITRWYYTEWCYRGHSSVYNNTQLFGMNCSTIKYILIIKKKKRIAECKWYCYTYISTILWHINSYEYTHQHLVPSNVSVLSTRVAMATQRIRQGKNREKRKKVNQA